MKKANSAFHPFRIGNRMAGKLKATQDGRILSVSGSTRKHMYAFTCVSSIKYDQLRERQRSKFSTDTCYTLDTRAEHRPKDALSTASRSQRVRRLTRLFTVEVLYIECVGDDTSLTGCRAALPH